MSRYFCIICTYSLHLISASVSRQTRSSVRYTCLCGNSSVSIANQVWGFAQHPRAWVRLYHRKSLKNWNEFQGDHEMLLYLLKRVDKKVSINLSLQQQHFPHRLKRYCIEYVGPPCPLYMSIQARRGRWITRLHRTYTFYIRKSIYIGFLNFQDTLYFRFE